MRNLFAALAVFLAASPVLAADSQSRDVAYATCLMKAFEHDIRDTSAQDIYILACMRVAGYEPDKGGLTGSAKFRLVSGG
jgi:hypothetical protein